MPLNKRSQLITAGVARSPNRAMLRAVGFGDGDFKKPIVGVANGDFAAGVSWADGLGNWEDGYTSGAFVTRWDADPAHGARAAAVDPSSIKIKRPEGGAKAAEVPAALKALLDAKGR